jgi:hypothetical protein
MICRPASALFSPSVSLFPVLCFDCFFVPILFCFHGLFLALFSPSVCTVSCAVSVSCFCNVLALCFPCVLSCFLYVFLALSCPVSVVCFCSLFALCLQCFLSCFCGLFLQCFSPLFPLFTWPVFGLFLCSCPVLFVWPAQAARAAALQGRHKQPRGREQTAKAAQAGRTQKASPHRGPHTGGNTHMQKESQK